MLSVSLRFTNKVNNGLLRLQKKARCMAGHSLGMSICEARISFGIISAVSIHSRMNEELEENAERITTPIQEI
ncbi:hypothetical protein [Pedobacter sp.]|uniref:hypothetical protein n=1 Tax=Pedobacter sp. TaxID=1411316 RepID=UPI003D7F2D05